MKCKGITIPLFCFKRKKLKDFLSFTNIGVQHSRFPSFWNCYNAGPEWCHSSIGTQECLSVDNDLVFVSSKKGTLRVCSHPSAPREWCEWLVRLGFLKNLKGMYAQEGSEFVNRTKDCIGMGCWRNTPPLC